MLQKGEAFHAVCLSIGITRFWDKDISLNAVLKILFLSEQSASYLKLLTHCYIRPGGDFIQVNFFAMLGYRSKNSLHEIRLLYVICTALLGLMPLCSSLESTLYVIANYKLFSTGSFSTQTEFSVLSLPVICFVDMSETGSRQYYK